MLIRFFKSHDVSKEARDKAGKWTKESWEMTRDEFSNQPDVYTHSQPKPLAKTAGLPVIRFVKAVIRGKSKYGAPLIANGFTSQAGRAGKRPVPRDSHAAVTARNSSTEIAPMHAMFRALKLKHSSQTKPDKKQSFEHNVQHAHMTGAEVDRDLRARMKGSGRYHVLSKGFSGEDNVVDAVSKRSDTKHKIRIHEPQHVKLAHNAAKYAGADSVTTMRDPASSPASYTHKMHTPLDPEEASGRLNHVLQGSHRMKNGKNTVSAEHYLSGVKHKFVIENHATSNLLT